MASSSENQKNADNSPSSVRPRDRRPETQIYRPGMMKGTEITERLPAWEEDRSKASSSRSLNHRNFEGGGASSAAPSGYRPTPMVFERRRPTHNNYNNNFAQPPRQNNHNQRGYRYDSTRSLLRDDHRSYQNHRDNQWNDAASVKSEAIPTRSSVSRRQRNDSMGSTRSEMIPTSSTQQNDNNPPASFAPESATPSVWSLASSYISEPILDWSAEVERDCIERKQREEAEAKAAEAAAAKQKTDEKNFQKPRQNSSSQNRRRNGRRVSSRASQHSGSIAEEQVLEEVDEGERTPRRQQSPERQEPLPDTIQVSEALRERLAFRQQQHQPPQQPVRQKIEYRERRRKNHAPGLPPPAAASSSAASFQSAQQNVRNGEEPLDVTHLKQRSNGNAAPTEREKQASKKPPPQSNSSPRKEQRPGIQLYQPRQRPTHEYRRSQEMLDSSRKNSASSITSGHSTTASSVRAPSPSSLQKQQEKHSQERPQRITSSQNQRSSSVCTTVSTASDSAPIRRAAFENLSTASSVASTPPRQLDAEDDDGGYVMPKHAVEMNTNLNLAAQAILERRDVGAAEKLVFLSHELAQQLIEELGLSDNSLHRLRIAELLWRRAHLVPMEALRRSSNRSTYRLCLSLLHKLLLQSISTYERLIDATLQSFGARSISDVVFWPDGLPTSTDLNSSIGLETSPTVTLDDTQSMLLSQMLYSLGEILRLQVSATGSEDYRAARLRYLWAAQLGNSLTKSRALNRIAVVAERAMQPRRYFRRSSINVDELSNIKQDAQWEAVWACCRGVARGRLADLWRAIRQKASLYNEASEPLGDSPSSARLFRRAATYLLHSAGILIFGGGDDFDHFWVEALQLLDRWLQDRSERPTTLQLLQLVEIFEFAENPRALADLCEFLLGAVEVERDGILAALEGNGPIPLNVQRALPSIGRLLKNPDVRAEVARRRVDEYLLDPALGDTISANYPAASESVLLPEDVFFSDFPPNRTSSNSLPVSSDQRNLQLQREMTAFLTRLLNVIVATTAQ